MVIQIILDCHSHSSSVQQLTARFHLLSECQTLPFRLLRFRLLLLVVGLPHLVRKAGPLPPLCKTLWGLLLPLHLSSQHHHQSMWRLLQRKKAPLHLLMILIFARSNGTRHCACKRGVVSQETFCLWHTCDSRFLRRVREIFPQEFFSLFFCFRFCLSCGQGFFICGSVWI